MPAFDQIKIADQYLTILYNCLKRYESPEDYVLESARIVPVLEEHIKTCRRILYQINKHRPYRGGKQWYINQATIENIFTKSE
jgi:hypothetical protein